jgi:type IV pilus assembly protein PilC
MEFVCRLGTPEGRVVQEVHRSGDEGALRRELEQRGLHVFDIRRRGLPLRLHFGRRRLRRIPMRPFLVFNQELAALLRAGLPLLQALDMMLERLRDPLFRRVLVEVRERVRGGEDLSEAFARFGDLFPPLYASTLKAGERSGELEQVLRRFLRYQRLVWDARKRVISALIYPAVLIGLSLAMIAVMTIYVIPRFTVFYSDMKAQLPLITRVTLAVSYFLRDHLAVLTLGTVAAVVGLRQWSRTAAGRVAFDRWRLAVPFLGQVFHRFALSEFFRSLATLLAGGIPLVSALEISVGAVGNAHVRRRLEPTIQKVREGKAFHAALEETGIVPDLAIDMVKVGEATGALDAMLSNASDFFDEEVETHLQRILTLVEPALLVVMGLLIATLLISVYLPMFSVLGQVQT